MFFILIYHIFEGIYRRRLSEKYKLKVYLYPRNHNIETSYSVHFRCELDNHLKRISKAKFEETHTRKEFIDLFFKVIYKLQY